MIRGGLKKHVKRSAGPATTHGSVTFSCGGGARPHQIATAPPPQVAGPPARATPAIPRAAESSRPDWKVQGAGCPYRSTQVRGQKNVPARDVSEPRVPPAPGQAPARAAPPPPC